MRRIALLTERSREYGRELMKGVAAFAQTHHGWIMQVLTPEELRSTRALDGFDGVIARVVDAAARRLLVKSRLPVVDTFCQEPDPGLIGVDCDHDEIGRMAADYFLSRRFRSFAFCGFSGTAFSDARCRAFTRTLADAGFSCAVFSSVEPLDDSVNFAEKPDLPRNARPLRDWFAALPPRTAVFCANDLRAYQLLRLADELGVRIPQDAAILGVDNDTLLCSFATPPLSSIDPNAKRVGYAAARLLHAAMENPVGRKRRTVFRIRPGELMERTSSAFYPVEPEWLSEVLVFIDNNLSRPVSTIDLVRIAKRSHTTVEKVFRKTFGESAGRYIMRLKMMKAVQLIRKGGIIGKEVAARTGFSSPQYFCRAYRAFFGHTPFS